LKIETITSPFTGDSDKTERIASQLKAVALSWKSIFPVPSESGDILLLEAASSTSKTSWVGFLKDYRFLVEAGLDGHVESLMDSMKMFRLRGLWNIVRDVSHLGTPPVGRDHFSNHKRLGGIASNVGQLALKKEAAGKLRVFALVDVWTQSILKPIHDSIFSFLESLPNDATFDQRASVRRCFDKVAISGVSFGYDLSAATDRLPISLQVSILEAFLGKEIAHS